MLNKEQISKLEKCFTEYAIPRKYVSTLELQEQFPLVDNKPLASCSFARQTQSNPTITKDIEMSNTIDDERSYLRNRIYDISDTKFAALDKKYGFREELPPKTVDEMQNRLKEGKYTVHSNYTNGRQPVLLWKDPSIKEDEEGFKKAKDTFDIERQKALDIVNILPPVEALKVLAELEAYEV